MKIRINGEARDLAEPLSLAQLVETLGMKADRVAVELNREIVQRTNWTNTPLQDGDKLEIVHFVGGGCAPYSPTPERGDRFHLPRLAVTPQAPS